MCLLFLLMHKGIPSRCRVVREGLVRFAQTLRRIKLLRTVVAAKFYSRAGEGVGCRFVKVDSQDASLGGWPCSISLVG